MGWQYQNMDKKHGQFFFLPWGIGIGIVPCPARTALKPSMTGTPPLPPPPPLLGSKPSDEQLLMTSINVECFGDEPLPLTLHLLTQQQMVIVISSTRALSRCVRACVCALVWWFWEVGWSLSWSSRTTTTLLHSDGCPSILYTNLAWPGLTSSPTFHPWHRPSRLRNTIHRLYPRVFLRPYLPKPVPNSTDPLPYRRSHHSSKPQTTTRGWPRPSPHWRTWEAFPASSPSDPSRRIQWDSMEIGKIRSESFLIQ